MPSTQSWLPRVQRHLPYSYGMSVHVWIRDPTVPTIEINSEYDRFCCINNRPVDRSSRRHLPAALVYIVHERQYHYEWLATKIKFS